MKATLEFTLPDERVEHMHAVHAGAAWAVLHELDCEMRSLVKHNSPAFATVEDLARYVRERACEALQRIDE